MRFERRRPQGVFLAGLLLLFMLTAAAPWSWRRLASQAGKSPQLREASAASEGPPGKQGESTVGSKSSKRVSEATEVAPPPVLPPLVADLNLVDPARAAGVASPVFSAGPIVESDEYDAYTVAAESALEGALSQLIGTGELQLDAADTPGPPADELRSSAAEKPPVAVAPAAPVGVGAFPRLQIEDLQHLRDALWTLLDEVQRLDLVLPTKSATSRPALRVQVESPDDRLAMAPPRPGALVSDEMILDFQASAAKAADAEQEFQRSLKRLQDLAERVEPLRVALARDLPRFLGEQVSNLREESFQQPGEACWIEVPTALTRQVALAGAHAAAAEWSERVNERLEALSARHVVARSVVSQILDELSVLATQGFNDALRPNDPRLQRAWLRACRGIQRRLPLWRALADPEQRMAAAAGSVPDDEGLRHSLHEIVSFTAYSESGEAWRNYLRLHDLSALLRVGSEGSVQARRRLCRDVLARLQASDLSAEQQAFLGMPIFASFASTLKMSSSGPIDLRRLASLVERYERDGLQRDADAIAEAAWRLSLSSDPRLQQLGAELDRQYRNANMRIAFSEELLNRLIPRQPPMMAPVNDRVAGAEVRGRSQVSTEVRIRLLPDARHWKLGLEAAGVVHSRTYSDAWPARLRNAGNLEYEASKLILVGREGLQTLPAEASAHGRSRLLDVETQFDPVPLIGDLLRGVALQRHRERQPEALAEAKTKVARQAQQRLDRETDAKLRRLESHFQSVVLRPLEQLAIVARPLDMHTTEKRAVMRLRMADAEQLAAHTPRPSAPSDSLASFQLHESALNNAVAGLDLNGKRLTVEQLHELIAERLRGRGVASQEDLPKNALIEFASVDAVRLHCDEDRVRLRLSIAELALGRDSIKHVVVCAYFRPEIDGLEVRLAREGTLQFEGPALRTGTRMVLHGVFNKLIRKDEPLTLLPSSLGDDSRMKDLMITQLVIEDGWVALALGPATPQRTAWRTGGESRRR